MEEVPDHRFGVEIGTREIDVRLWSPMAKLLGIPTVSPAESLQSAMNDCFDQRKNRQIVEK
jgi:hypothetical protein